MNGPLTEFHKDWEKWWYLSICKILSQFNFLQQSLQRYSFIFWPNFYDMLYLGLPMGPQCMRILSLSLKVWGFLRLRIEFGQTSRIFEDEGYIKLLRFLTLKPQKTSMFEVRMRGVILRFFEDSSKNLEKKSKNRVFF